VHTNRTMHSGVIIPRGIIKGCAGKRHHHARVGIDPESWEARSQLRVRTMTDEERVKYGADKDTVVVRPRDVLQLLAKVREEYGIHLVHSNFAATREDTGRQVVGVWAKGNYKGACVKFSPSCSESLIALIKQTMLDAGFVLEHEHPNFFCVVLRPKNA
jgi:hypothetical protein